MAKANQPKVIKNLEVMLSKCILHGLIWEKTVGKGSGCGTIHVPESLIGKKVRMILLPVCEEDSLSVFKKVINANDDIKVHKAQISRATNRKVKAEEELKQQEDKIAASDTLDNVIPLPSASEEDLEDEDAY